MKKLFMLFFACVIFQGLAVSAQATPMAFEFTGTTATYKDLVHVTFTLEETREVHLFSSGRAHGTDTGVILWDAGGNKLAAGEDTGGTVLYDGVNYSLSGVDGRVSMTLDAGTYILTLVNYISPDWVDRGTIGAITNLDDFIIYRDGRIDTRGATGYSLFVLGADAAVLGVHPTGAVPVPAAVWLMGSGLAGLGLLRRKMGK